MQAAMALDVDTQDSSTLPHASADSSSSKNGGSDMLGARDCPSSSGSSATPSNDGTAHSGGDSGGPSSSHRVNLGWQSLLPGSIQ